MGIENLYYRDTWTGEYLKILPMKPVYNGLRVSLRLESGEIVHINSRSISKSVFTFKQ